MPPPGSKPGGALAGLLATAMGRDGGRWGCLALLLACVASGASAGKLHVRTPSALAERQALEAKVDRRLAELRAALLESGETAVDRFSSSLPKIVAEARGEAVGPSFPGKPPGAGKPPGSGGNPFAGFAQHTSNSTDKKQGAEAGVCLFDDMMFSLTEEAKYYLWQELQDPNMKAQLDVVRRGGWWQCAAADRGIYCQCNGVARLVDIDRTALSSAMVDVGAAGGWMQCDSTAFGVAAGQPYPSVDGYRSCECWSHKTPDATSADGFHLEKRMTSVSYLQEAWVFLLRLMGKMALFPLGSRDRTYSGVENWAARLPVGDRNKYVNHIMERYWIIKYIRQAAPHITGPKCLEWGNPNKPGQELLYASLVAGCTENYDMQFDGNYWLGTQMHVEGNVIHSDILNLPNTMGPYLRMNAIFATQVFEHLADPKISATALFESLAPGGVLVYTAPQHASYHKVPHDYLRYTKEGVKFILVSAGFCVPNNNFAGGGDFVMDVAMDAGLQVEDFSMEEVDAAYQATYDAVSHSAIGIHTLAFKPPHSTCSDPTAGWAELQRQGIRA